MSSTQRIFWRHLWAPLVAFLLLALVFELTTLDIEIARAMFFDTTQLRWIGRGHWWIDAFAHTGGRWFVRTLVATTCAVWIASSFWGRLQSLRRPAAYLALAMILSLAIVGLLKMLTNVNCPWDLTLFGGRYPFVPVFADRPDALPRAQCFPAAHASSGYALVAFYFALRERKPTFAVAALLIGLLMGAGFGLAQQSRGAHFMSHDLWSAFIVWVVTLSVYAFGFGARLHSAGSNRA